MSGIFEEIDAKMENHEPKSQAEQIEALRQQLAHLQGIVLSLQGQLFEHVGTPAEKAHVGPAQ